MSACRRFVFVVPRYGDGIVGGGEAHCRAIVERLVARGHHVRVATTTATSYQSWRKALPAGLDHVGGVEVERFPVRMPRLAPADEVLKWASTLMKQGGAGLARLAQYDRWSAPRRLAQDVVDFAWIDAQGPVVPALVDALPRLRAEADVVVFFGYLYYPTIRGVRAARDRAVIVPLADEEPMLYAPIVRRTLRSARALLANVEEEAERVRAIIAPVEVPIAVVALGIDPPPPTRGREERMNLGNAPFVLVLGRAGKTRPMAAVWRAITSTPDLPPIERNDGTRVDASKLTLVTAGEVSPHLAGLPRVVQLGRVEAEARWGLTHDALAMVSPSESESLSLVVLESWVADRMVVVNRACDATSGHVRRSGGGVALDFSRPEPAARALVDAIAIRSRREELAARGRRYVEQCYGWEPVLRAYEAIADALAEERDVTAALTTWARHRTAELA